jgi:hypothetical protein
MSEKIFGGIPAPWICEYLQNNQFRPMTVERHWFAFCSEFEVTGQFIRYHTPKLRKPFTL